MRSTRDAGVWRIFGVGMLRTIEAALAAPPDALGCLSFGATAASLIGAGVRFYGCGFFFAVA